MCGIVGIVGNQNVAGQLYDGLTVLQHRGQDAAGIATADGTRLRVQKANGLVRDVFDERRMAVLEGRVGIAHCRYPTAGSEGMDEAQPFYVNSPYGIALAHNGNLTNTEALRQQVFEADRRNINTDSDSEVLLNVFAHELDAQRMLTPEAAIRAVAGVHRRCRGGYAVVSVVLGLGLVAFRDPHGIRPLVLGKRENVDGDEYIVASESAALDILGFTRVRDVRPGEALVITARGELFSEVCATTTDHSPCIFEYVYFARPDSMIDNVSVHKARMRMGMKLGEKILRLRPDHDIDTIIPIPDTSRDAALEISNVLGVKYREGFVKNRYVGRTFIMPGQGERVKSVRRKLNPIHLEFRNRVVLLVDDSIVRGTTSTKIVDMVRQAGAKEVHLRISSPPTAHPCFFGIDTPSREKLLAAQFDTPAMAKMLGVDSLAFISIDGLYRAVNEPGRNADKPQYCDACFTGEYPLPLTDQNAGSMPKQLSLLNEERR